MTTPPDLRAIVTRVRAGLTAPGGPFELAQQEVAGRRVAAFTDPTTLTDLLAASAAHGAREHLVCGEVRLTFAQHAAAVASLGRHLADVHGVGRGDRVMILAGNCAEWVVTFWATASLGAIAVAGNAWWSPREVAHAVGHSRPRLVVADERRRALVDAALPAGDTPVLSVEDGVRPHLTRPSGAALPVTPVDPDDPVAILYTSGTTGLPKGAVHSHRNLLAVIHYHRMNDAVATALGAPPALPRVYLMSLPLFHIASLHNLALPRLATGDTVVVHAGRFDVDTVLRVVERERVTNWAIVPTMAHRIAAHGDLSGYDLSSLGALSINSAPSSPALKERLRRAVPAVRDALADSYGLTEACTAVTVASAAELAGFPDTVGSPIVGVELEIRDAGGRPVPEGVDGEICTRSQYVMLRYWEDPAATATAIDTDGWLHTGDLGRLVDGRLYMASRRSDLILRGGENVYPAEVEAALSEHPDVAECAVHGVPHEDLGEEVAAVVVPVAGSGLDVDALRGFLRDRLAAHKVPAHWLLRDDPLPRTATGKVVRAAVRDLLAGDGG